MSIWSSSPPGGSLPLWLDLSGARESFPFLHQVQNPVIMTEMMMVVKALKINVRRMMTIMTMTIFRTSPPLVQNKGFPTTSLPRQVVITMIDLKNYIVMTMMMIVIVIMSSWWWQGPARSMDGHPSLATLPHPPPLVRIFFFWPVFSSPGYTGLHNFWAHFLADFGLCFPFFTGDNNDNWWLQWKRKTKTIMFRCEQEKPPSFHHCKDSHKDEPPQRGSSLSSYLSSLFIRIVIVIVMSSFIIIHYPPCHDQKQLCGRFL